MAEEDLSPEVEKRIRDITEHLETLECFSKFLYTLAGLHEDMSRGKSIDISLDTLEVIACAMDVTVDTISAELGLYRYKDRPDARAYILKPQTGEGGAE